MVLGEDEGEGGGGFWCWCRCLVARHREKNQANKDWVAVKELKSASAPAEAVRGS